MQSIWLRRVGALAAVVILALAVCLFKLNYDLKRGEETLLKARVQREAVLQETQALREELDYMQTDEYALEKARADLGLIWPNEVRYVTN